MMAAIDFEHDLELMMVLENSFLA